MKGYYIIPSDKDLIEITGRNARERAIKEATDLYNQGDKEVFVQQFNDDDSDGFTANGETIFIKKLVK